MKTTIEIADSLLAQARQRAAPFTLRRASFKGKGKGLRPEVRGLAWDTLREQAYDGRGT